MPTIINVSTLPSTIPKKLNKYKRKLCETTMRDCITMPSPVTASGGMTATEMAMPVIASGTFGLLYAYAPATPLKKATRKKSKLGSRRDTISAFTSGMRPSKNVLTRPINAPVIIANSAPNADATSDIIIRLARKIMIDRARSNIGVVSGATTIAPITTLELFRSNPSAASADDSDVRKKKLNEGRE